MTTRVYNLIGPIPAVTIGDDHKGDAERYGHALWYAWGRKDGGDMFTGDAFDFARDYATRYRAFRWEREFYMPSMQEAFALWVSGKPID